MGDIDTPLAARGIAVGIVARELLQDQMRAAGDGVSIFPTMFPTMKPVEGSPNCRLQLC
jgi:hypothetical protein